MKTRSGRMIRTGIVSALLLALSVVPALGASGARAGSSSEGIPIEKLIERHAKKDAMKGKIYACRIYDSCDHFPWHQKAGTKHRPS